MFPKLVKIIYDGTRFMFKSEKIYKNNYHVIIFTA